MQGKIGNNISKPIRQIRNTTLLPMGRMAMRTIINPKMEKLMADGADLTKEYNMGNVGNAGSTGDLDRFPAGAGQISALIKQIKSVKVIIEGMVA